MTTAAGPVEVAAPRVNDKRVDETTGERQRLTSKILAPWCRKSPKISEMLPPLYLHGLSSGDFMPAMQQFLGSSAGLSPATVTRLTQRWTADHAAFQRRGLAESDYVYVYVYLWANGVHPKIRLSQTHSWLLVLMGVRVDAPRNSWRSPTVCASPPNPGRTCCATVGGAGCATRCSWSATVRWACVGRWPKCSAGQAPEVLGSHNKDVSIALPKSAQPGAKKALREIYNAEDRAHAEKAVTAPHLVALVRAGARFENGLLVERDETLAA